MRRYTFAQPARTLPSWLRRQSCARACIFDPSNFSSFSSSSAASCSSFSRDLAEDSTSAKGSHKYAIAYCTCPTAEVVEKLSALLLERKLVACVSSWPVTSQFVWQGKVEKESEHLMMIKTRADNVAALTRVIKENHPYEVPEVISVDIQQGYPPYLKWLADVTEKAEP